MVEENGVVVISREGCCITYTLMRLLHLVGARPLLYTELAPPGNFQLPAVFINGRWFGGLERVIATHIAGELIPLLSQAGAL